MTMKHDPFGLYLAAVFVDVTFDAGGRALEFALQKLDCVSRRAAGSLSTVFGRGFLRPPRLIQQLAAHAGGLVT